MQEDIIDADVRQNIHHAYRSQVIICVMQQRYDYIVYSILVVSYSRFYPFLETDTMSWISEPALSSFIRLTIGASEQIFFDKTSKVPALRTHEQ